jgi:hypothetical protein
MKLDPLASRTSELEDKNALLIPKHEEVNDKIQNHSFFLL